MQHISFMNMDIHMALLMSTTTYVFMEKINSHFLLRKAPYLELWQAKSLIMSPPLGLEDILFFSQASVCLSVALQSTL